MLNIRQDFGDKECMQNFGRENFWISATWKNETQIEIYY
jgi:hypothetical protein